MELNTFIFFIQQQKINNRSETMCEKVTFAVVILHINCMHFQIKPGNVYSVYVL